MAQDERNQNNSPETPADAEGRRQLEVDDSQAVTCYANFCRVTSAPEEVIVDIGLNPQPLGSAAKSLKISQRIVMNYYTAKRLLRALHHTVHRYESTFGELEIDVQKRVVGGRPAARE